MVAPLRLTGPAPRVLAWARRALAQLGHRGSPAFLPPAPPDRFLSPSPGGGDMDIASAARRPPASEDSRGRLDGGDPLAGPPGPPPFDEPRIKGTVEGSVLAGGGPNSRDLSSPLGGGGALAGGGPAAPPAGTGTMRRRRHRSWGVQGRAPMRLLVLENVVNLSVNLLSPPLWSPAAQALPSLASPRISFSGRLKWIRMVATL
eukprot:15483556-Alexandrium_andersonii.AAC.1